MLMLTVVDFHVKHTTVTVTGFRHHSNIWNAEIFEKFVSNCDDNDSWNIGNFFRPYYTHKDNIPAKCVKLVNHTMKCVTSVHHTVTYSAGAQYLALQICFKLGNFLCVFIFQFFDALVHIFALHTYQTCMIWLCLCAYTYVHVYVYIYTYIHVHTFCLLGIHEFLFKSLKAYVRRHVLLRCVFAGTHNMHSVDLYQ